MGYTDQDWMDDNVKEALICLRNGDEETAFHSLVIAMQAYDEIHGCPDTHTTLEERRNATEDSNRRFHEKQRKKGPILWS